MILHCISKEKYEKVKNETEFIDNINYETEKFNHCSYLDNISWVKDKFYKDKIDNTIVLFLDENLISYEIKEEVGNDLGYIFPHVYGPIETKAIVKIKELKDL